MAGKKKFLKGFANVEIFTDLIDNVASGATRIMLLDGANSCSMTDNRNDTSIPGDDDPNWYSESVWESTDLEVVVHGMELEQLAGMLGIEVTDDGTLEESINDEPHRFAMTFSALRSDMGYRLYRYYSCQLTSYAVSHQTRSTTTESQDYTLRIKAYPRKIDGKIRASKDTAKGDALTWLESIPVSLSV